MTRSKWFLPGFAVLLGLGLAVAVWIGGDPTGAVLTLAVMIGFAAIVLFGGRSETIRGLRGDGRDERFRQIDVEATAIAGLAVISAIIVAFALEVARGNSGSPDSWLGAVAGLAYLVAVVVLRVRS
jgi:hypothetical protein